MDLEKYLDHRYIVRKTTVDKDLINDIAIDERSKSIIRNIGKNL